MAMPMAIIGGTFSRVWSDRDKILIAEKAKTKMADGGFTKDDLQDLFSAADTDRSGHINRKEFVKLIQCFHLGFTHAQAIKLFKSIDEDSTGLVSFNEFCDFLFPEIAASLEEHIEQERQAVEDQRAREYAQNFISKVHPGSSPITEHPRAGTACSPPEAELGSWESLRSTANAGDLRASADPASPKSGDVRPSLFGTQAMKERESTQAMKERESTQGKNLDVAWATRVSQKVRSARATEPKDDVMVPRVSALEERMGVIENSISNLRSEHRRQFQLLMRGLSPAKEPMDHG